MVGGVVVGGALGSEVCRWEVGFEVLVGGVLVGDVLVVGVVVVGALVVVVLVAVATVTGYAREASGVVASVANPGPPHVPGTPSSRSQAGLGPSSSTVGRRGGLTAPPFPPLPPAPRLRGEVHGGEA